MNSPSAKFTMPVMPNVKVTPSAMMPYSVPTMTPFSACPTSNCSMNAASVPERPYARPLARLDLGDADLAAARHVDDVEVDDLLTLVVVADLPQPVVGHREQGLADLGDVADSAGLLHRLDEHEDVVVARRRTQRRLVVREVALVVRLVVGDELGDLRIGLLRLLEIFRDVDEVVVDLVLVLQARAERAAHQEEFAEEVALGRLAHDVGDRGVAVAGKQH